ncbi:MAG: ATP-binding protein [Gammaproteobacteria bacterium]|nr:ATP-binding protein [Gammaproteobacteria bacterium]
MRFIYDNLTGRVILILLLGAALIALDVLLVGSMLDNKQQDASSWISVSAAILFGLIFIGYIISRQLIKPLRRLAETAQRFSTDLKSETLVLKGPKEVRDTAQSFNQMQQRIQRFVEERMQLIAAISHDLRTPLTRLRLRVETIEDEEQRNKALRDIEDMRAMIQSTLAFIRDDAATEVSVKADIASLVQTICDDTSDIYGPATYTGPDRCISLCKPNSLKRALANIIENGVIYGKNVTVTLSCGETEISLLIDDQGDGIPPDQFENVFLPFYRIDKSRNRETGGIGLGMSVSRTTIHAHGGKILLSNKKEGGLRVEVKLIRHQS